MSIHEVELPIRNRQLYDEAMENAREALGKQLEPIIERARVWVQQEQVPYVNAFNERRQLIIETYGDWS